MLYRLFRYRESLNSPDAETLYDREFAHDEPTLEPSVYRTESLTKAPQITAEHYAAAGIDPPNGVRGVDVSGLAEGTPDPTTAPFKFIRLAHNVLKFSSKDELREFVAELFGAMKNGRVECISEGKDRVREYVIARLAVSDHEWETFLGSASKEWRRFARRGS